MIEHLKVHSGALLPEAALTDLGQINVICGKNNSGKTTLLRAIENKASRRLGKQIDTEDVKRIVAAARSTATQQTIADLGRRLAEVVNHVAATRTTWFLEDLPDFRNLLDQRTRGSVLEMTYGYDPGSAIQPYEQIFTDNHQTVLLPPRRAPELKLQREAIQEVSPTGSQLANRLFWMKNQFPGNADRLAYDRIINAFTAISGGFHLWIDLGQANELTVLFHLREGPRVGADDCGLGLQDLLVILYYAIATVSTVVLIEEPESHMHPTMQKRLLEFLKTETQKQYFLTTHSNVFLNNAFVDRVFFTSFTGSIQVTDTTKRASILDDLGYSVADNLVSDLVILVEGPTDVAVLEELLQTTGTFSRYDIRMWPLGGDNMEHVNPSVFHGYKLLAVVDQDPQSAKARKAFVKRCRASGIAVTRLKRYAVENYFPLRVLREVFGGQIPAAFAAVNPNIKLETQIGINVKNNNRKIARSMTLDEVKATDDLYNFLLKVEKKCKE